MLRPLANHRVEVPVLGSGSGGSGGPFVRWTWFEAVKNGTIVVFHQRENPDSPTQWKTD